MPPVVMSLIGILLGTLAGYWRGSLIDRAIKPRVYGEVKARA